MEAFCRGCLMSYDDIMELLHYTEKIERLYVYSTGIRIRSKDRDFFKLCKGCFFNMKQSCKFKKQCRISDKKFKHYLSLKEIGDTYDIATFLKNNEDSIRYPSQSGNSTPANHKVKDDDNESTCTSMRNFMTDLLQGEEVPDTEENIIREVIEETSALDDTLDSHYLQDDVSVEHISRLDLSFSPFSTAYSVSNDHCNIPLKENESYIHNSNTNTKATNKGTNEIQNESINRDSESVLITSNRDLNQSNAIKDSNTDSQDLFDSQDIDYVTQNENVSNSELNAIKDGNTENQDMNYVTQNENDIAVKNLLQSNAENNIIYNESYYAVQALLNDNVNQDSTEQLLPNIGITNEESLINDNLHNEPNAIDKKSYKTESDIMNYENESCIISTNKEITKEESLNNDNLHNESNAINKDSYKIESDIINYEYESCQIDTEYNALNENILKNRICINIQSGTEITINGNQIVEKWTERNETLLETEKMTSTQNDNVQNNNTYTNDIEMKTDSNDDVLKDFIDANNMSTTQNNNKYTIAIDYKKVNESGSFEEALKAVEDDKISISDLIVSPTGFAPAQGASTPMINNLLFGETLDLDSDTKASKCSGEFGKDDVNILDEILNEGIQKFDINTEAGKSDVMYDLSKLICKTCNKNFKVLPGLKRHLTQKHKIRLPYEKRRDFDNKPRICPVCGKMYRQFSAYNRHLKKHKVTLTPCSVCKLTFTSDKNLALHMKCHNGLQALNRTEKINNYICKICGAGFSASGNFSIHMRRHDKAYTHNCDECDRGFYRKADYEDHIRVHTGERPFQCQQCDRSFARKYSLVKHTGVHLDDKTFQCDYCSKKFTMKSDMVSHITKSRRCLRFRSGLAPLPPRRIPGKRYTCGYCHQEFYSPFKLKVHQKHYMPCRTFYADPALAAKLSTVLEEQNENMQLFEDDEDEDVEIMEEAEDEKTTDEEEVEDVEIMEE